MLYTMPLLWYTIIHSCDKQAIKNYWLEILQTCRNEAKKDDNASNVDIYLKKYYAPYSFGNMNHRYDYIVPPINDNINTVSRAMSYIRKNHKLYDPAYVIQINKKISVIGGNTPCYCDNDICVRHRLLTI